MAQALCYYCQGKVIQVVHCTYYCTGHVHVHLATISFIYILGSLYCLSQVCQIINANYVPDVLLVNYGCIQLNMWTDC